MPPPPSQLGLCGSVVGRSHECDHAEVAGARVVTSDKLGGGADRDVDMAMRGQASHLRGLGAASGAAAVLPWLELNLGVYRTDVEALVGLGPDIVLTQVQGLGASPGMLERVEEALSQRAGRRVGVVHLAAADLEGSMRDVEAIAGAAGRAREGGELVARLRRRMQFAADCSRGRPRRRVACLQWADPVYPAGGWAPELIRMAGGVDCLGQAAAASPSGTVSLDAVASAAPDVVLLAVCGVGLRANQRHAGRLARELRPRLAPPDPAGQAPAAGGAAFASCDGTRMLSRPGPLLVDSLEMLVEILNPEAQSYGRAGRDWAWADEGLGQGAGEAGRGGAPAHA